MFNIYYTLVHQLNIKTHWPDSFIFTIVLSI